MNGLPLGLVLLCVSLAPGHFYFLATCLSYIPSYLFYGTDQSERGREQGAMEIHSKVILPVAKAPLLQRITEGICLLVSIYQLTRALRTL